MTTITAMFRTAAGWAEPPEPGHRIKGLPPGQILTPDHPAWHHRNDLDTWFHLSPQHNHNPFHDALKEPDPGFGDGSHQAYWGEMARHDPRKHAAALHSLRTEIPRMRLAMAMPSIGLEEFAREGHMRSAHDLDDFEDQHWSGDDDRYLGWRTENEGTQFGYPEHHSRHARPNFGYLTHHPATDPSGQGFGEHTLVLSRPALAHRTSFTLGDSLDDDEQVRPAPLTDPRLHAVHPDFAAAHAHHPDAGIGHALRTPHERGEDHPYAEAQIHGGISHRHVHYAILRRPSDAEDRSVHHADARLQDALSTAGIPWVRTGEQEPREPRDSDPTG